MMGKVLILTLFVGALTYLMRALPLIWGARQHREGDHSLKGLEGMVALVGPSLLAGLLAVSVTPVSIDQLDPRELLDTVLALVATAIAYRKCNSLGAAVLVGTVVYGLLRQLP